MFTGIIEYLGKCQKKTKTGLQFMAPDDFISQIKTGSSVSVNGVCLSVSSIGQRVFDVDIMKETWQRTAFGYMKQADLVNLELPLGVKDRFQGHIVQGHIDGVGKIKLIRQEVNSYLFTIDVSGKLTKYMVEKGSIAINGISLTLINVNKESITVSVTAYTYQHTMLQKVKALDLVNIEVDVLAKYFFKFYEKN